MNKELSTPYFEIDEEQLLKDVNLLITSLSNSWNNYLIGYSFKTNSLPWLVTFLKEQGMIAEVVSADEYSLAKYLGFHNSEIIYNGPCKDKNSFKEVLYGGGYINIDSLREVKWLSDIAEQHTDKKFKVGIRMNFDLEKMCPGETTMGGEGGRFGFSYENGAFKNVLLKLNRIPNVKVVGLHLHSSSKTRSVKVFESIASMAVKIKQEYKMSLEYVDIGGGYCGGLPERPTYSEYFPAIAKILGREFDNKSTKLLIEPGISLISKASTYVTSVLDKREINGKKYLVTDGSRFHIDPTMIKSSYIYHVDMYEKGVSDKRDILQIQYVTGYSCMEVDRIFEISDYPELIEGDRIVYENVGGYTISLSPLFIQYFPKIYVKKADKMMKVRDHWGPEEYSQKCVLYGQEEDL